MTGAAAVRRLASSPFVDSLGLAAAKRFNGCYHKATAPMIAPKGFGGRHLKATDAMASYQNRFYSAKATPPAPLPKLLLQVNGKVLPSMEAGSTNLYQMTLVADTEEEALKLMQKFVSLVKKNDPAQLAAFLTNETVTLSEVKELISVAATEARKQASEHFIDIKSEVDVLKTACLSGQEDIKGLKELVLSNSTETVAVKEVVQRIEADGKRFTLLKLISYAGIISVIQAVLSGSIGWQYIKPYIPDPPSAETVGMFPPMGVSKD